MSNVDLSTYVRYLPVPMCILDDRGRILAASPAMSKVFAYGEIVGRDIFVLTNVKYQELLAKKESGSPFNFSNNDMTFRVNVSGIKPDGEDTEYVTLTFTDISGLDELLRRYNNDRPYVIVVDIDNYNDLIGVTDEQERQTLRSAIDRHIRMWGLEMKASVTRFSARRYIMFAKKEYVDQQIERKFPILDEVREIPTETDFPVTLSIGVGTGGEDMSDNHRYANQAMDMAKGRGGDQAVIKNGQEFTYYGGSGQSVEKRSKGKSMIIGYALRGLIDTASNVFIMGHKNPDMDCFGAAMGIYALVRKRNKRGFIVIDETTEALDLMYDRVMDAGDHEIIPSRRALQLIDDKSVVILVDTHRIFMSACPELYERAVRTVIIDHHRQAEEIVKQPTVSYMESYASSASELVTEILQNSMERKDILNIEADALLAGIIVDTNNYWAKTGARTFEASAWLKRSGADSEAVKQYFQIGMDNFRTRIKILENTVVAGGAAYAWYDGQSENAQISNSQAADDLITVRGVKASFTASRDMNGRTLVSARSIGDCNVQVIMEQFDGGGHRNMAGAFSDEDSPEEILRKIRQYVEEEGGLGE